MWNSRQARRVRVPVTHEISSVLTKLKATRWCWHNMSCNRNFRHLRDRNVTMRHIRQLPRKGRSIMIFAGLWCQGRLGDPALYANRRGKGRELTATRYNATGINNCWPTMSPSQGRNSTETGTQHLWLTGWSGQEVNLERLPLFLSVQQSYLSHKVRQTRTEQAPNSNTAIQIMIRSIRLTHQTTEQRGRTPKQNGQQETKEVRDNSIIVVKRTTERKIERNAANKDKWQQEVPYLGHKLFK